MTPPVHKLGGGGRIRPNAIRWVATCNCTSRSTLSLMTIGTNETQKGGKR